MATLAELKDQKAQYSNLRNNVSSAMNKYSSLKDGLSKASESFKNGAVVNGKPFDDGKLLEFIGNIDTAVSNLNVIYEHCCTKINELQAEINRIIAIENQKNSNNDPPKNKPPVDSKFVYDCIE